MDRITLDDARGRWVLLAAVLGSGMAMLDATVVNIALPALGRDLGAGFAALQWTINGYTLTLAAFILLGGSLGDRFGRRRVFVVGTVWFAAASLLCGLAPNVGLLVAARLLQGVGGALLTPGSLALIAASFASSDRARAIGAWSGLGGIAGALGPFLGGVLVQASWRLVFFLNLPLAVVVVLVTLRHVPESRDEDSDPHLDVTGALLGVVGLAGTTYALIGYGASGATPAVLMTAAVGIAGLVAFVLVERRSRHPMLPVAIFADRQFTAANLVTFAVYAALSGVFFLLVVHLQVVARFTPLTAGTALLPVTLCMLALSSRAGALSQRIGPRLPMTLGPLICAGGVLLLRRIGPGASYLVDVLPGALVFGLGLSLTVAPLTATALAAAATRYSGLASGVNNAVARAAGLLAVAVLPVVAGLSGDVYQKPTAFLDRVPDRDGRQRRAARGRWCAGRGHHLQPGSPWSPRAEPALRGGRAAGGAPGSVSDALRRRVVAGDLLLVLRAGRALARTDTGQVRRPGRVGSSTGSVVAAPSRSTASTSMTSTSTRSTVSGRLVAERRASAASSRPAPTAAAPISTGTCSSSKACCSRPLSSSVGRCCSLCQEVTPTSAKVSAGLSHCTTLSWRWVFASSLGVSCAGEVAPATGAGNSCAILRLSTPLHAVPPNAAAVSAVLIALLRATPCCERTRGHSVTSRPEAPIRCAPIPAALTGAHRVQPAVAALARSRRSSSALTPPLIPTVPANEPPDQTPRPRSCRVRRTGCMCTSRGDSRGLPRH